MPKAQPIKPGPRQESVWDYPRPPRLESTTRHLQVFFSGRLIAATHRAYRVLETSHPPVYYFPPGDVDMTCLTKGVGVSWCEWKGKAGYYDVRVGDSIAVNAAWYYSSPSPDFLPIKDHVAFYPGRVERCLVDGEVVVSQSGDFYGGWITGDIVGPFKGGPGTMGW